MLRPQVQDAAGVAQGLRDIMGDHDDGDALLVVQLVHHIVQLIGDGGVQPGKGLIHKQQAAGGAQGPCQQHPLLLPAGKLPVAAVCQVLRPQQAQFGKGCFAVGAGVEGGVALGSQQTAEDDLHDRGGEIPLDGRLLGQITNLLRRQVEVNMPAGGADQSQDAFEQGGFARPVFAYDGKVIPLLHRKLQMGEDTFALIAQRKVTALNEGHDFASFSAQAAHTPYRMVFL